ncbi:MAG: HEPN domain-containing protein [Bryobacteraceae bacterium]|nr:HEPN domain-containing protein [Bryobacteraceae bacterium]
MRGDERTLAVVREWIEKAESDLKNTALVLRAGQGCPTDTVCFHAQQCAEKYLKGYLAFRNVDFPKTHEIEKLISLLRPEERPGLTANEQARLTQYAVRSR